MADRFAAIGGNLTVSSSPDRDYDGPGKLSSHSNADYVLRPWGIGAITR